MIYITVIMCGLLGWVASGDKRGGLASRKGAVMQNTRAQVISEHAVSAKASYLILGRGCPSHSGDNLTFPSRSLLLSIKTSLSSAKRTVPAHVQASLCSRIQVAGRCISDYLTMLLTLRRQATTGLDADLTETLRHIIVAMAAQRPESLDETDQ